MNSKLFSTLLIITSIAYAQNKETGMKQPKLQKKEHDAYVYDDENLVLTNLILRSLLKSCKEGMISHRTFAEREKAINDQEPYKVQQDFSVWQNATEISSIFEASSGYPYKNSSVDSLYKAVLPKEHSDLFSDQIGTVNDKYTRCDFFKLYDTTNNQYRLTLKCTTFLPDKKLIEEREQEIIDKKRAERNQFFKIKPQ